MSRKLLVVTFDIKGAKPGDRRYSLVDDYLKGISSKNSAGSHLFSRAFKQTRLVVTPETPQRIQLHICALLGTSGNVFVASARKPYRFRHRDPIERILVLREFLSYA